MKNTNKAEAATVKAGDSSYWQRKFPERAFSLQQDDIIAEKTEELRRLAKVIVKLADERGELLKVLKWIAERLERGGKAANSDTVSQARAAIAQAEKEGV